MRVLLVVAALIAAALATERCALRCYAGTVDWHDTNSSSLDFSFSVLPCQPVVVVSATLSDDTSDQPRLPNFGCISSEHVVSIMLDHEQTHLEWRYQTDSTCEQVLGSLDTVPGTFLGTEHRIDGTDLVEESGSSLEDLQKLCEPTCDVCIDSSVFSATGRASDKSPCGEKGTKECAMRVQWHGNTCTGAISSFDVFVGDDHVPLSAYQPSAVEGAQIRCQDGAVTVETEGVMLSYAAPELHNGDCTSIMGNINPLAGGKLERALIQLSSNEMWTATSGRTLAGSEIPCETMSAPQPPKYEDPQSNSGTAETAPIPIAKAIVPFVNCSRRTEGVCCSVFGYHNPNGVEVTVVAGKSHNYFVPGPSVRSQPSTFAANSTETAAFSVAWDCPQFERHKLRWILDIPSIEQDSWYRSVDAVRERNDCSDEMYELWCL